MSAEIGELFIQLAFKGDLKGADAFKKKIAEVARQFGATAKASDKAAKQTNNNIAQLINGYVKVIAVIKTAIATYHSLVNAMNTNQIWINMARQTDLALSSLQSYADVASVLDKSLGFEGAAQSIANLEQRLYELKLTGQGAEGFLYAGINPMGKNAFQVIEELRNKISGLSNDQASFLMRQLGLDPRLLPMLRMTRGEFEALRAELKQYELTPKQRQDLQKLQQELTIVAKKMQYFRDRIVVALMPALTKLAKVVLAVAEAFKNVLTSNHSLAMLTKIVTGLTAAVIALGVAIWAVTAHPIVALITAIIGALMALIATVYLVVDDIIGWTQGKDSVIGYVLGVIDEIVADERVPQWIRDLLYIIGQAPEVLTKVDKFLGNDKKLWSEQTPEEKQATLRREAIGTIAKNSLSTFGGMGGMMIRSLMDVFDASRLGANLGRTIINQYNQITTSETSNTLMEELKSAQVKASAES